MVLENGNLKNDACYYSYTILTKTDKERNTYYCMGRMAVEEKCVLMAERLDLNFSFVHVTVCFAQVNKFH